MQANGANIQIFLSAFEKRTKEENKELSHLSLEEMDFFWNEAKKLERENNK